ncbi:MAG: hypothetical protein HOP09_05760 [Hyphomicrobium sp.]|nr:hypothetical protein [Hyphomicrobium sp.]
MATSISNFRTNCAGRMGMFASSIVLLCCSHPTESAERGLSSYLPAYYGDFAVAIAPKPGFYAYATYYGYEANFKPQGAVGKLDLNVSAFITGFQYVFPEKLANISFAVGGYTAIIDARLHGVLSTQDGSLTVEQNKIQHGDTSISPLIMYWSSGNWHVNVYEAVFLPTGTFDAADSLNLSRNYFSFDTVAALTWLDRQSGLEVSLVPGLMMNTQNEATNYLTGPEFHIDAMVNVFLAKNFALGLHGYAYMQIAGDELNGQNVPSSLSRSNGIGPSLLWVPDTAGVNGKVVAKWLHDLDGENRFQGDIFSLTGVVQF